MNESATQPPEVYVKLQLSVPVGDSKQGQDTPVRNMNSSNPYVVYTSNKSDAHTLIPLNDAVHSLRNEIAHETEADKTSGDTPEPGQGRDILTGNKTASGQNMFSLA